jgi:hypothetical protein
MGEISPEREEKAGKSPLKGEEEMGKSPLRVSKKREKFPPKREEEARISTPCGQGEMEQISTAHPLRGGRNGEIPKSFLSMELQYSFLIWGETP